MSWLERCAAFHFQKTHPTRVNNYTRQGILLRATLGSMPKSGCEGSIKKAFPTIGNALFSDKST